MHLDIYFLQSTKFFMRSIVFCIVSLFVFGCEPNPEAADANEAPSEAQGTVQAEQLNRPDPSAPSGEEGGLPDYWRVVLDRPSNEVVIGADKDESDIFFVNMTPGWHITSGPAAIYYHPASTAEGNYGATLNVYLFDPGERNEAFGFFIGGENLDASNVSYDYFLIRNSGEYLIKRRRGADTELIQDWTSHEAINLYTAESESSVMNELGVEVNGENVEFRINGEEVVSLPASEVKTEGIVGLRVNHALNLHISNLEVINQEG